MRSSLSVFAWMVCATSIAACQTLLNFGKDPSADGGLTEAGLSDADVPATSDADPRADASVDGGVTEARPSPCDVAPHTVCDDFDKNAVLVVDPWTKFLRNDAGLLEVSATKSASPPRSLHVFQPEHPPDAADMYNSVEWRRATDSWTTARIAFDARFDITQTLEGRMAALVMVFRSPGGNRSVVLFVESKRVTLSVETHQPTWYTDYEPPPPRWARYSVEFNRTGTVVYSIDGKSELPVSFVVADPTGDAAPETSLNVSLGLHAYLGGSPAIDAWIDNVTIDLE